MTQTRLGALIESLSNVAVGLGISISATMLIFPALGYPVKWGEATWISAFFTAVSIARSYLMRRFFEWWWHGR